MTRASNEGSVYHTAPQDQILRAMVQVLFSHPGEWLSFQRLSRLMSMPGTDAHYLASIAAFRTDLFAIDRDRRLKLRHDIIREIAICSIQNWRVPAEPTPHLDQGFMLGTEDHPQFSLIEDCFNGYPVVELLKNGGPIHPWDSHFQFGQRKAEIVIACLAVLTTFWRASEDERRTFAPKIIENERRGLRIQIGVEMQPDFEISMGAIINRPWLYLHALPPDDCHIGLGVSKCQAVCALEKPLKEWLRKQGVPA